MLRTGIIAMVLGIGSVFTASPLAVAAGDDAAVQKLLAAEVPEIALDHVPARQAFDSIQGVIGITILADWRGLHEIQIEPETPVTAHVARMPAGQSVAAVLAAVGAGKVSYQIVGKQIVILANPNEPSKSSDLAISRSAYFEKMDALNQKASTRPAAAPSDIDRQALLAASAERTRVKAEIVSAAKADRATAQQAIAEIDRRLRIVRANGVAAEAEYDRLQEAYESAMARAANAGEARIVGSNDPNDHRYYTGTVEIPGLAELARQNVTAQYQPQLQAAVAKVRALASDQAELVQMRNDILKGQLAAANQAIGQSNNIANRAAAAKLAEEKAAK